MLEKAVNVATRLSIKNEPDLLQEVIIDEDSNSGHWTREQCETLLSQTTDTNDIPEECKTLQTEIIHSIRRRQTSNRRKEDSNNAIAFAGMPSGSACAAMSNREKGHLHQAQIQRRQTSRNEKGKTW